MAKSGVVSFREQMGYDEVNTKGMQIMKAGKASKGGGSASCSNNKLVAGGTTKDGKFASASNGKTMLSSFGGKKGK